MTKKKTKLELTWIGKENRPKLEPRILIEDPEKSYHARHRVSENDIFDNRLIFGDNLLALKALEQEFAGKIKCIYIDPPYNTGAAFEHYDDGVEHSLWLSLVRDRLEILRTLLSADGSLWVSIDDVEYAYLRVLLDEVFGRANFSTTIIWDKRKTRENRRVFPFKHDYVVLYAKNRMDFILFPSKGTDRFVIVLKLPTGTSLKATSDKVEKVEKIIAALPEKELASYVTRIGGYGDLILIEGENYAMVNVSLTSFSERERTADEIVEVLRGRIEGLNIFEEIKFEINTGGPPVGKPVKIGRASCRERV